MPEVEASIGAAAARAVLTSTVPSSAVAPRRPPRRILSGGELAQPPRAPLAAAAAAAARAGAAGAANAAAASDAPLSPANAALLAELHRCVSAAVERARRASRCEPDCNPAPLIAASLLRRAARLASWRAR